MTARDDKRVVPRAGVVRRIASAWKALTSIQRRRIVLGSLLAASLAAWDLVLLVVVGGLFALSELTPAPRPVARASS